MSLAYDLRYGSTPLIVLVNPRNIVAFPAYDQTKGRCCEYLPIGIAETNKNGEIIPLDNSTLDLEYLNYSEHVLEELLKHNSISMLQSVDELPSDLTDDQIENTVKDLKAIIKARIVKI